MRSSNGETMNRRRDDIIYMYLSRGRAGMGIGI